MISLTGGLAGTGTEGGGSYMRLIMAPFDLMPNWSGFVFIYGSGGHSHAGQSNREETERLVTSIQAYEFFTEINGKTVRKTFTVKFPIPELNVINIEIRDIKVTFNEN